MAEALVSLVLEQLASFTTRQIEQGWGLVSGFEEKVESLCSNLEDIQMVLVDADKRQVSEASVKRWLDKLKAVSYEIDTTVYEWNTAIALRFNLKLFSKVCFFTLPCLHRNHVHRPGLHHRVACKIDRLNEKLNRISSEKERYTFTTQNFSRHTLGTTSYSTEYDRRKNTTSFVDVSKVCGREREKEILIEKLLVSGGGDESNQITRKEHDVIPLVGMGGIGKTTLAQLVYNDEKVNAHFNLKIWVCVSDPFDEITIARQICVALGVNDVHKLVAFDQLLTKIKESIVGRKFLLVLDDVWTEDNRKWEQLEESLKNGAEGSKILVTTRKKRVATMMKVREDHVISISHLSEAVCLNIFNQLAFLNNESQEQLKEIGVKIAQKCKGLPLVAKSLGSLVRFKKPTEKHWNEVFVPFLLSYYDLPPLEKRCLLYCSIFPKDYEIDRVELIQLWMSQGYLSSSKDDERKGIDCFENLATRSFFQDFKTDEEENIIRCKMHDIVHDFVLFLTKNDCFNSVISRKNDEMNLLSAKAFHCTLLLESEEHVVPPSLYSKRNLRTLSIVGKSRSIIKWDLLLKLTCLRTLNLSGCLSEESRIPKDIDKLILLRYLNLSNNVWLELPKTLGNLFNLQTLKLERSGGWLPKEIGKLVNLRHLYLGYSRCKFPKELGKLIGLQTLESQSIYDLVVDDGGKVFQSWMTSLNNLKSLKLEYSGGCESLGPFGKLPSLESLTLKNMCYVETVGNEFFGIEDTTTETPAAFPKLKRLHFQESRYWIEWKSDVSSNDQIMPCLQSLKIEDCPMLEAPLPRFLQRTPLKTLTIKKCDKLQPLLEEELGTEELVNILTSARRTESESEESTSIDLSSTIFLDELSEDAFGDVDGVQSCLSLS